MYDTLHVLFFDAINLLSLRFPGEEQGHVQCGSDADCAQLHQQVHAHPLPGGPQHGIRYDNGAIAGIAMAQK